MAEPLLAGVLPEIYSRTNAFKRKLVDALRNPGDTLRNVRDNVVDDIKRADQMVDAASKESMAALRSGKRDWIGPRAGPASDRLTQAITDAYNPAGITVWHGSPHRFTRFDASKIGTGEGSQAYGHGLYVAELPEVAEQYQKTLAHKAQAKLEQVGRNNYRVTTPDGAVIADGVPLGPATKAKTAFDADSGALYKIDLPDEHVARMLDWDKPLAQQGASIGQQLTAAIEQAGAGNYYNRALRGEKSLAGLPTTGVTGEKLYRRLTEVLGNQQAASDVLRSGGVPGIRYLDAASRNAKNGTSNFVVFPGNEDLLTIQEINGQPVQAMINALRTRRGN